MEDELVSLTGTSLVSVETSETFEIMINMLHTLLANLLHMLLAIYALRVHSRGFFFFEKKVSLESPLR